MTNLGREPTNCPYDGLYHLNELTLVPAVPVVITLTNTLTKDVLPSAQS